MYCSGDVRVSRGRLVMQKGKETENERWNFSQGPEDRYKGVRDVIERKWSVLAVKQDLP